MPGVIDGVDEGGAEAKTDTEGKLGMKDLFGKELWLITVVMWLAWPIGELSSL